MRGGLMIIRIPIRIYPGSCWYFCRQKPLYKNNFFHSAVLVFGHLPVGWGYPNDIRLARQRVGLGRRLKKRKNKRSFLEAFKPAGPFFCPFFGLFPLNLDWNLLNQRFWNMFFSVFCWGAHLEGVLKRDWPHIFHVVFLLQICKSMHLVLPQAVNFRHFCLFWTKSLVYALRAETFCIFALGAEAAFYWCLAWWWVMTMHCFNGINNKDGDDYITDCVWVSRE